MLYDKYEHQTRAYSPAIMWYQALLIDLSRGSALKFCSAKNTLYPCNGSVLPSSDPCTGKIMIGLDLIDNHGTNCTFVGHVKGTTISSICTTMVLLTLAMVSAG